ncbi:general negative regulator of transcription subunit 4 [Echria macrotheca]|uniref:General negative regulator of transcription subunit 4 n=1 Tax=Echria macrotheca TaxID=438768 RepID=A0AAJ0F9R5_9PEZI|nr:general negative regulator of transcription subunit 4 [Echria macrotheca]
MAPQDSFIDDEEETCPLCIEAFDLSDRNFRPCPCGYQICQFCFNNIKTNMNNLCPACRRPYDEKTIQWKVVTPEQEAEFRANIQKKRAAEQRQKEVQKRETEKESRKHLVGVRVVQKNLVYVTGLTPTVREDELLKTLREPKYFGQYGNIQKISISHRKSSDGQNQSLGIYVTFERKEDAAKCIQAVNGSVNGDRILKAQLGTTKYCSAWLRHEQCANRQCMFLHELGDEEDSYTRQDLSSMNSISTQTFDTQTISTKRSLQSSGASRPAPKSQSHPSPAAQAAQPMVRSSSKEDSENGDGSALPSSANWARNPQVRSRRGSHATSGAAPSPAISHSLPVTAESAQESVEERSPVESVAGPSHSNSAAPKKSKSALEQLKATSGDPIFGSLLKSLSTCKLAWPIKPGDAQPADIGFPLFDSRGWEKRRAMREEEDGGITEDQDQVVEAREPSEGEPESSGSLALGGEPEDLGGGRDGNGFDLRRNTQPPIQRSTADGIFGPALGSGFGQGGASLGSVGSRTMTPQQPNLLRHNMNVPDQFPPGISSQSGMFQGQGHNRQGSRFNFANESREPTSSTSVKLAANPRIMAQQTSMMPSTFHSQPGNQYYASSMPGPPPGLKSTGTPPSMFGQYGFGSAFGTGSKDSPDLLQLLRSRGAGNQAHDAGKREYLFPSLPNQYPPSNSSTPAPAANVLASLYGSQPGAFQDFGSKQKKKGKKHRHANTSSSGGSGLVDLADPSILQARMQSQQQQHVQHQGNAGFGQGLFGGQSQDDDFLPLEGAETIVDALVSDEPLDSIGIRHPPGMFESFGRSSTPSVPPGLGFPANFSHPSPTVSQSSLLGHAAGRQGTPTPVVLPIVPVKPAASASTPQTNKTTAAVSIPDAKKNIKALAVESGLSKDIAKAKSQKALQDEDFPALGTPKVAQAVVTPSVAPKAAASKSTASQTKKAADKSIDKEKEKPAIPTPVAHVGEPQRGTAEKRPIPGVLNIAAATRASQTRPVEPSSAADKSSADKDSAFPALPTPTTASVSSPLNRPAPKTLRVVPTPKTELPPVLSVSAATMTGPPARGTAAAAIRSETPVSELISDSASIISAPMTTSRTSSPPPTKVGTAPVRTTTKSQQRKQRKEALKKDTATIEEQPTKQEAEVEIAPIVGRKKKKKKEKEKPASRNATPTASRPQTPHPAPSPSAPTNEVKESQDMNEAKEVKESKEAVKEETSMYRSTVNETMTLTDDTPMPKGRDVDIRGKGADGPRSSDQGSTPRAAPTPAIVLQDLQAAGLAPANIDDLALFKPISWQTDKPRNDAGQAPGGEGTNKHDAAPAKFVTKEDERTLKAGQPVRKTINGVRLLLTPNGDCLKNLTAEEEDRFLELQQLVAESAQNPAAFVSSRHEGSAGFSLIKGRAVPNGPPSYFPAAPGMPVVDPSNKIHREEAIHYINQYVLPRLNLNAREQISSNTKTMMPGWNFDARTAGVPTGQAGLGSIAPWTYGPTTMPADTDAAAPELNYPGPVGSFADNASNNSALASYLESHTDQPRMDDLPLMAPFPGGDVGPDCTKLNSSGVPTPFGNPFENVPMIPYEEAEQALSVARKETDKLEKTLNQMMRKNRRLLTISAGGH